MFLLIKIWSSILPVVEENRRLIGKGDLAIYKFKGLIFLQS